MGKAAKRQYFAVINGHEGTKIYPDKLWSEIRHHVDGASGVVFKGHPSHAAAERWMDQHPAYIASKLRDQRKTKEMQHLASVASPKVNVLAGIKAESMSDNSVVMADSTNVARNEVLPQPVEDNADSEDSGSSVHLSPEQLDILERVRRGENVFFTGSAGTGKSLLIREIMNLWDHSPRQLAITTSTGAASVAFKGGRTFHSWAGIGQGAKTAELLLEEDILPFKTRRKRLRQTRCLIIDEISMIDRELFDKVEYICRVVQQNNRPFGGIQLVVSGDFFQLPPVPGPQKGKAKFAFEAGSWPYCFNTIHRLTHVFRQSDEEFVHLLNEMKIGRVSAETTTVLQNLDRRVDYPDGIGPVELYPTKEQASEANQRQLDDIKHPLIRFVGYEIPYGVDDNNCPISDELRADIRKRLAAPQDLDVKEGAQVMLIRNMIQGKYVNGSVGVIEDFCTIDEAIGRRIFPFHDPKTLESAIKAMPNICRDPNTKSGWTDRRYPLVRFPRGRTLFCHPVLFHQENRFGRLMAGRIQVPLIIAWALSIHKSQGATLERVKVDLARVFERGQAYVALSRATSMESLQVLNFNPLKVEAHPYVLRWMGHEVDPQALEDEDWQRARALENYRQSVTDYKEEDFHHYDIQVV
ncbi:unnamed protein product [Peniophora sp. CBMAI 1063]|nr:unnamed protein product [Peniophora sp. CBMAI 1063]